jgi:sulfur-carrier protein
MKATPTVSIGVPWPLRRYSGGARRIDVEAPNVRAALGLLEQSHPDLYGSICDETGAVRRHINLFVNTTHIRERDGLDTPLAPGDVLEVLPAVSGG